MIALPARAGAAPRAAKAAPPPSTAAPPVSGSDGGDGDNQAAAAALDARITALISRATTPEDEELEREREAFDFVTRARAEFDRETNALRDLAVEQMKHEDELLKKAIDLI